MIRIDLPNKSFLELHENFLFEHECDHHTHEYYLDKIFDTIKKETSWKQNHLNIRGELIPFPRLTMYYGEHPYHYSGILNAAAEMPSIIKNISNTINNAGYKNNAVLCNYYRDGSDSIGWHCDDEKEMPKDHVIASLSLGESRTFKIKSKEKGSNSFSIKLKDNDLLVMGGKFQEYYLHHIAKEDNKDERINLTFRIIEPTT